MKRKTSDWNRRLWMRFLPIPILLFAAVIAWNITQLRTVASVSAAPPMMRTVEVLSLSPEDVSVTIRSHGVVEPRIEVELVSQTSGLIVEASPQFVVGGHFEKDDLLLRLDPVDAEIALLGATARYDQIYAQLQRDQSQLNRIRELATKGFVNSVELEHAEYTQRINLARLQGAEAHLKQVRRDLALTEVRAPFSGKMREKSVDVGQFVERGTKLGRIYANASLEVRLPISETDLKFIELPERTTDPKGAGSKVLLSSNDARQWRAHVVRVEHARSERSRLLHLVVQVENASDKAPASQQSSEPTLGGFLEATITGKTLEGIFVLPRSALTDDAHLLVVDADGRLQKVNVEVLRFEEDQVLISSGVAKGDKVAVSSIGLLSGARARFATVSSG